MTPWLVHELRNLSLEVVCLDARHARAALKLQINKTDQNDAESLAQIVRTGWNRAVHVKSFDSHRARALLGARSQLVGMTTRLSNHIRGVLKTIGLLPGAMRGLPFDRKVEALLLNRRQLREQIVAFDKAIRVLVRSNSACRLFTSVPGVGVLSALVYVSTVEDPARFVRSRSVGAHLGLTPRQYQSGEVDRSGRISKCGDTLARTLMYEADITLISSKQCPGDPCRLVGERDNRSIEAAPRRKPFQPFGTAIIVLRQPYHDGTSTGSTIRPTSKQ
jgi:transposase